MLKCFQMYMDDTDQASHLLVHKPKFTYKEANQYYEECKKELFDNKCTDIESNTSDDTRMEVQYFINDI